MKRFLNIFLWIALSLGMAFVGLMVITILQLTGLAHQSKIAEQLGMPVAEYIAVANQFAALGMSEEQTVSALLRVKMELVQKGLHPYAPSHNGVGLR